MANLKNAEKIRPDLVHLLSELTDDVMMAASGIGRTLVAAVLGHG